MTTYTNLVASKTTEGSIKQWVNNSYVPSTTILTEAEAWIYQRLRVRQMLTSTTGTATASSTAITLPDRYRQAVNLMFTPNGVVAQSYPQKKTLQELLQNYTYDGTGVRSAGRPLMYAADASELKFEKMTDQAYPYQFDYYQAMPALTGTATETNFLTQDYPKLLRSTCMALAYEFLKNNAEKVYWLGIAQAEINQANIESDLELSGADLEVSITEDVLTLSL